jgi:4-hydroxy-tetrahydrodipicolinate synthase
VQHSTHVISLTPFDAEERLDEEALRAHLRRLRESGIGVYLAGSGSGEGYTLTEDETLRILQIGVEELKGHVPVRHMGVEPRTAGEMLRLADIAREAGVDAMQVYSLDVGHGHMPHRDELDAYYHDVLSRMRVPAVISTHQSVGYFLPLDLLDELVGRYDIVGINVTTPDHGYIMRMIDRFADRVEIHCGGPMHALSIMALGGTGYLSSEGNLAPKLCVSLIRQWDAGDITAASATYSRIMHLLEVNSRYMHITATKTALSLLGLPGGYPRKPRLMLEGEAREDVRRVIEAQRVAEAEGIAAAASSGGAR